MAEDKRAEAMRKAIAEADAQKASVHAEKPKGKFNLGDKMKLPNVSFNFKEFWQTKMGKIICIAVVAVLVLIIAGAIFSNISGKVQMTPPEYEITNAIMNMYECDDVPSGYAYDAYVEVLNTGTSNIYLKDLSFKILADDSSHTRIMVDNNLTAYPAIIQPGEKGYVFNRFGTEVTGLWDEAKDMSFILVPSFVVMRSEAVPHAYDVSDVTISESENGHRLSARVTNNTANDASSIYVGVLVYNEDGYCCGISQQFVRNVEAHATVPVIFDPLNMVRAWKTEEIVDYVVYAY